MNFSKFFARAFTLAFWLGACLGGQTIAQVTTNGGSGLAATYPSLAAAITALNGATISSPVTITLTGSETAIPGGYIITAEGTNANPIVIQGSNSTITASAAHTVGVLHDAIFELRGADYITIQNFTLQENPANTTFGTAATNNMTEWAIALLYASTTNGAQNNTLQNNTISLNRAYRNTFGIYSNVRHNATAMTTTADITAPTGANSGNKVYSNSISNVNYGIVFVGANAAANMDMGNDVGGNSLATGNTLTDWGGASALSSYVSLTGNNVGIFMNQQINDNISFNTLTSANISGTTVAFVGIQKAYSATSPSGNLTITISSNTITLASANTGGNMTGIVSSGVSNLATAAAFITNNQIVNCSITGASTTSAFTGISNTSSLGDLTISNNTIKGLSTTSTSGNFAGISNSGAIINTNTISNNKIGDASAGAVTYTVANTGVFNGIINASAGATGTATIASNDIRGINYAVAASHAVNLINNSGSAISLTVISNTFTNLAINTSAAVTFISHSYGMQAGATQKIEQNSIVGGFSKLGAGAQVVGIGATGTSPATATSEYLNNNFSNITVTGATNIFGVSNNDGTGTGSPNRTIAGNTFANWTGGTGALVGIGLSHIGVNSVLNQNNIHNLNTAGNVSGITISSVSANGNPLTLSANTITALVSTNGTAEGINSANASPMVNITDNRVYNLVANGASANGLVVSAGASVTAKRNKIGDIQNNATNGVVNGVLQTGGTQSSLTNNIIGDLRAPAANSSTPAVVGVNISGITVDTARLYFNTIFLNASSTGTNFSTAGVFVNTTTKTALNNNIIVNSSVATGAGASVAYRRTDATLTTYLAGSNRNDFFAPVIYADGTNSDATLAAYKTRVASRDANSINENPNFLSTTVSAANYLHINTTIATGLESGGADAGVAVDYDGDIRQGNAGYTGTGTAPDMGADEFELVNTNCASASTGTITNPSAAYCVGGTHTLSASVPAILPGISYQWKVSNTSGTGYTDISGATVTTYSTTGLAAGVYYYVLSTSCSFSATTALSNEGVLTVHANPSIATSTNPSICASANGTATATASLGNAPYSYMWSNMQTTATATGLATGSYTVTVSSANACTATASVSVSNSSSTILANISSTNPTCSGNNGTVSVAPTGGSTPYTYMWSNTSTTANITGLSAGNYGVTIMDANMCSVTAAAILNQQVSSVSASISATQIGCTNNTATATISPIGGTAPYAYVWSNTQTTATATGLAMGAYSATLTDACGASATASVTVVQPAALNVTVTSANTTCSSCTDGSVNSMVMGGLAPYMYMWSNTRTTQNITGLGAGRYDVTVTDANGCTATAGANVATTLGVAQTLSEQVRVFPNPSQSLVFVDGLPTNEAVRISLQNALGQTLWTVKTNQESNFQADLSGLPTGAYFLSIQTNKNQFSKQVLKID